MNNIIKKYNVYIKVAVLAIIIGVCGILYCIHKNSNNNNNDITIDKAKQYRKTNTRKRNTNSTNKHIRNSQRKRVGNC